MQLLLQIRLGNSMRTRFAVSGSSRHWLNGTIIFRRWKRCLPKQRRQIRSRSQRRRTVSPLAEVQALFRQAVVTGEKSRLVPLLSGGRYPAKRLAIHQRHYETSLVTALLGKFPATTWLTGTRFVTEAATRFVHDRVPQAPCIAEYGREFPMFLSSCRGAVRVPYLNDFAELEWQVGQLAIAVEEPA